MVPQKLLISIRVVKIQVWVKQSYTVGFVSLDVIGTAFGVEK